MQPHTPTLPMGLRLGMLWLFAILNMLFRDIHELTTASALEEILSGYLNGVAMTEGLLVIGAFVVELLLVALLFSVLWPRRRARILNLIIAPIAILGTIAARPSDPDDFIFAAIEITTFVVIFIWAYRWTGTNGTATQHEPPNEG